MPSNESPTDSIIKEFDQPSAILNENLEIISANDSFCNSIQIEAADIVGLNILSIFSEGTVSKRISRKLKSLLKTGKRFSDSEVLCTSATGEVKFLLSASLISGRDTDAQTTAHELIRHMTCPFSASLVYDVSMKVNDHYLLSPARCPGPSIALRSSSLSAEKRR